MLESFDDTAWHTYSFDIFDTLITRPFLKPTDLFLEVAVRAQGLGYINHDIKKFQKDRITAEINARNISLSEDVTLDEIYSFLVNYKDLEKIKALEIKTEIELVVPIKKNIELFNGLVRNGKKVIIVSDMYLPSTVLYQMLNKTNLLLRDIKIYVSNEFGYTKRTGNLFKLILDKERLKSDSILHIGNDKKADFLGAKKAGIKCCLYKNWFLNRYEKYSTERVLSFGISRAIRLSNEDCKLTTIASNVIAPFLYNYVEFVLMDALEKKLDRLLFLSRDGQILYKIAKIIVAKKNINIKLQYIYASRSAWAYPSVNNFDFDNLKWVVVDNQNNNISDFIRRLELENFSDLIISFFNNKKDINADLLKKFIVEFKGTQVEDYVLSKSLNYRIALIKYFKDIGILKNSIGVVDIGWRMNMQLFLQKILKNTNIKIDLYGFYIGVNNNHVSDQLIVEKTIAYVKHPNAIVKSKFIDRNFFRVPSILLLEHVFTCSDHASLKNINLSEDQGYNLIFSKDPSSNFKEKICYIHYIIERYSELYSDLSRDIYDFSIDAKYSLMNTKKFIFLPKVNEVKSLSFIYTNQDIGHNEKYNTVLSQPIELKKFFISIKTSSWIYGSIALSRWFIRIIFLPFLILRAKF